MPASSSRSSALAGEAGRVQRVLLRVTPGIEADTHAKIVTGHARSKFGFAPADALDALDAAAALLHLQPAGLHVHLGSQIGDLGRTCGWSTGWCELHRGARAGRAAAARPRRRVRHRLRRGRGRAGGIEPAVEAICAHLAERLIAHGLPMPELLLEPGRSIVGPAGVTLYRVGAVKQTAGGIDLRRRRRRHVRQPAPGALRRALRRDRLRPGRRRAPTASMRSPASTASRATC